MLRNKRNGAILTLLAGLLAGTVSLPVAGQEEGEHQLLETAKALAAFVAAAPDGDVAELCTASFLKALQQGNQKLQPLLSRLHEQHGKVTAVRLVSVSAPFAGELEFGFADGSRLSFSLALEGRPPHKITSLLLRGVRAGNDSFAEVLKELRGCPGKASLCAVRLDGGWRVLAALDAEEPLAAASAFKLYVLGALAQEVADGKDKWEAVVRLSENNRSLPSGILQAFPIGSPVTLHTLAALMISRSDNTAADHLLHRVGRQRLEGFQAVMGVRRPDRNVPFLTTGEMFKLKLVMKPEESAAWVSANAETRRKLLATTVAGLSLARPRPLSNPLLIDSAEWFFSTADLCRALDWLRQCPDQTVRDLLAINAGLTLNRKHWTYVGFKGGAEPGVFNLSLLLRDKHNAWYALSLSCNDPASPLDESKLVLLMQRTVWVLERSAPPEPQP